MAPNRSSTSSLANNVQQHRASTGRFSQALSTDIFAAGSTPAPGGRVVQEFSTDIFAPGSIPAIGPSTHSIHMGHGPASRFNPRGDGNCMYRWVDRLGHSLLWEISSHASLQRTRACYAYSSECSTTTWRWTLAKMRSHPACQFGQLSVRGCSSSTTVGDGVG